MSPNSGSKKCWGCPASTPYDNGLCDDCQRLLPPGVFATYILADRGEIPQPYLGLINTAIVDGLRMSRAPRVEPELKITDLKLGDIL